MARIERLLAEGQGRAAVEAAKAHHQAESSAESEGLLVRAYEVRVGALIAKQMWAEARALVELVLERHPSSGSTCEALRAKLEARSGQLDRLLESMGSADAPEEIRAEIEDLLRRELVDPRALATTRVLPPEHPLRVSAAAVWRAFDAVTRGPVDDALLALPEVSRRSPLAPWKLLIRAIALLYRGDDAECARALDGIPADSAPARLAPTLRTVLEGGGEATSEAHDAPLLSRILDRSEKLRAELRQLDQAIEQGRPRALMKGIGRAVAACRKQAPSQTDALRRRIVARALAEEIDPLLIAAALGGRAAVDAELWRLVARVLEVRRESGLAASLWGLFAHAAVAEGWFAEQSAESATVCLHRAKLLTQANPDADLAGEDAADFLHYLSAALEIELPDPDPSGLDSAALEPGDEQTSAGLFERASRLDPEPHVFEAWLAHARGSGKEREIERVAQAWRAARPSDTRPLLELLRQAEKRGALRKALGYLSEIEAQDGVDPEIRRARIRLETRSALRHVSQGKAHLLESDIVRLREAEPTAARDRALLLDGFRWAAERLRGHDAEARARYEQLDRELGGVGMAAFLCAGILGEGSAKTDDLRLPAKLRKHAVESLRAVARIVTLLHPLDRCGTLPRAWLQPLAAAVPEVDLAPELLLGLTQWAIDQSIGAVAHACTGLGLSRAGPSLGRYLLLRARTLSPRSPRRSACLAAAASLARQERDTALLVEVVEEARSDGWGWDAESIEETLDPGEIEAIVADEIETRTQSPRGQRKGRRGPKGRDPSPLHSPSRDDCPCPLCELERELGPRISGLLEPEEDAPENLAQEILHELAGQSTRALRGFAGPVVGLLLEAVMRHGGGQRIPGPRELAARSPELYQRIERAMLEAIESGRVPERIPF